MSQITVARVISACIIFVGLLFIGVVVYSFTPKPEDSVLNSCMSKGRYEVDNYVIECRPVGIKTEVTLPSGDKKYMYNKFEIQQ